MTKDEAKQEILRILDILEQPGSTERIIVIGRNCADWYVEPSPLIEKIGQISDWGKVEWDSGVVPQRGGVLFGVIKKDNE